MKIKRFLASVLILILVFFGSNKVLDILQDKKNIDNYGLEAAAKNKSQVVDSELLILLVGVDKNPNSDTSEFTRTDTIMLCKVDTETGKVDILSIPRDSRIKVRDEFTKANHAHAYGGIELTLQSLRNFLGLDIDYYAEVDFNAVINIVDALGGVDYTVPEGIHVKHGDNIDIKPGKNHLSGEEVLWYLRTRSIYDNGDLGRVETQQEFLKGMVDEIVKKSNKTNLLTFAQTYIKDVKTNVPINVILNILSNIKNLSSKNVETHMVPGFPKTIDGISYYIPDFEKTWELIDMYFKDNKLEGWVKEDSGYDVYDEYDYSQDTNVEENSSQSEQPSEEVEVKTYYEYTYPDGRVEISETPPEEFEEETEPEEVMPEEESEILPEGEIEPEEEINEQPSTEAGQ